VTPAEWDALPAKDRTILHELTKIRQTLEEMVKVVAKVIEQ
jgi:hypothetical protein